MDVKRACLLLGTAVLSLIFFFMGARWMDRNHQRSSLSSSSSNSDLTLISTSIPPFRLSHLKKHPSLSSLLRPPILQRKIQCTHPALDEISGWSHSLRFKGFHWIHNDSLDQARLFLVNTDCKVLQEVKTPQATNIDWEDLTLDRQGRIYVADSGNNFNWRSKLTLYVFQEPQLTPQSSQSFFSSISLLKKIDFQFPHQPRYPPQNLEKRCYDSEALFMINSDLYLLTKCFYGGQTSVYRLPNPLASSSSLLTLEWIQDLPVGLKLPPFAYRVTAAEYLSKTQTLAVLSYQSIVLFSVTFDSTSSKPIFHPTHFFPLNPRQYRQVEAISWLDPHTLILANEQRDVFFIKMSDISQSLTP